MSQSRFGVVFGSGRLRITMFRRRDVMSKLFSDDKVVCGELLCRVGSGLDWIDLTLSSILSMGVSACCRVASLAVCRRRFAISVVSVVSVARMSGLLDVSPGAGDVVGEMCWGGGELVIFSMGGHVFDDAGGYVFVGHVFDVDGVRCRLGWGRHGDECYFSSSTGG
eukprot:GHVN01044953.1.p1 GENE.GHVN01044953.1~~GHVN01044953.1.p1  ORF type:complete len:166 (-),score=27.89 GHVN01044953.1:163-660(-)